MAININPQDFTGRQKADLAEQHAAEQRKVAKSMSIAAAAVDEEKEDEVDYSGPATITVGDVETRIKKKTLRVNTLLENVTIGHGNTFEFVPGQQYKVTADVYDYLDERGFVWH